jgi:hypothetical protein
MRRIVGLSAVLIIALALAGGCPNREVAKVDPNPVKEGFKDIPVQLNRDIDILFVIDNSGSMAEEQSSLSTNFQRFINVLESIEGGLPNVNIGVVSSDTGSNSAGAGGCTGNGDNGLLQSTRGDAAPVGCPTPTGAFIQDWDNGSGGRTQNFTGGTLAETFSCIAQLGTGGCGFEQHLESMRRALNGSQPANANFLREGAYLAVIVIADEDDCSTADAGMFDMSSMTVSDPLGPLSSYRCFEYGIDCDVGNDDRRAIGPRQDCYPRIDSPFMYHPDEYIDFLKTLKDDPTQIIVAGIVGNDTPVNVIPNEGDGNPELGPSCTSASGEAAPAIRLKYFAEAFPQRNTITTICNDDLSDALVLIANLLAEVIGNPCIEGDIDPDGDPSNGGYECQVSDVRFPGQDNQEETPIAECDAGMTNIPCWHFVVDAAACPSTDTHYTLVVERGGGSVPTGTHVQVRCVVN